MKVVGKGLFAWIFAIRPLHNALLEDALDKVKKQYIVEKRKSKWTIWVKILRRILK